MQSTTVMQYYGCVLLWFQMIHINAKGKKKQVFVQTIGG